MPDRCCVPGCKSNYTREVYTTVFHFPQEDQLKQKWIRNIHRVNFVPTKYSVVCIKHFEESCVMRERRAERPDGSVLAVQRDRVKLNANAVPSIFPNQPKYFTKQIAPKRKDPEQRLCEQKCREIKKQEQLDSADNIVDFENFKEEAAHLLLFESSHLDSGKKITLNDYISRAKDNRTIFYLAAPSRTLAESSPYYESLKTKQQEVLFCYEPYDELVLMQLQQFKGYKLVSVEKDMRDDKAANDLSNLGEDSLKRSEINDLSNWIKSKLSGKVASVNATTRLENHPCVITVEEMAAARHFIKTQSHNIPEDRRYSLLQPQLEMNPRHPIIKKLHKLMTSDPELAELLAKQLFANSMVGAGLVEDPRVLLTSMNDLLVKALDKH